MNTNKIVKGLVPEGNITIEGIKFNITRKIEDDFIVKNISFKAEGNEHHYCEKVRIIYKEDFLKYFNFAKLSLVEVFGDYELQKFNPLTSDRMIFIAEKK